ncbi:MAG: AtpZ/AtpI family protein [Rhodospirillales bacterium]
MTGDETEPLARLHERLERLKGDIAKESPGPKPKGGYGLAFTLAADLVGGLIGGTLLGWGIDTWLDTGPWGVVVFFFVGAVVGMWTVYRTVQGQQAVTGFPSSAEPANKEPGHTRGAAGGATDEGQEG